MVYVALNIAYNCEYIVQLYNLQFFTYHPPKIPICVIYKVTVNCQLYFIEFIIGHINGYTNFFNKYFTKFIKKECKKSKNKIQSLCVSPRLRKHHYCVLNLGTCIVLRYSE